MEVEAENRHSPSSQSKNFDEKEFVRKSERGMRERQIGEMRTLATSWSGGGGGGRSGDCVRSSEGSGGAKPYFELGIQTVKAAHTC